MSKHSVGMSSSAAVAGLERLGLAVVDGTGPQAQVRVTHPLYAEVVRAKMPEAAAIRVRQQLADGTPQGMSHDDPVRAGRLDVDSAAPDVDVALLMDAAGSATAKLDHLLAERLARAVVEAGGGVDAHLALFEALQWQGRPAEAEALAEPALRLAVSYEERARARCDASDQPVLRPPHPARLAGGAPRHRSDRGRTPDL